MINISVILISGGAQNPGTSVELLYTNGSRICSLPDLPFTKYQHSQTGLTACGGWGWAAAESTCHTLSSTGTWEVSHNLNQSRQQHSAWASPRGTLLLGGRDSADARTTTEILLENGDTAPGFNLDYETR